MADKETLDFLSTLPADPFPGVTDEEERARLRAEAEGTTPAFQLQPPVKGAEVPVLQATKPTEAPILESILPGYSRLKETIEEPEIEETRFGIPSTGKITVEEGEGMPIITAAGFEKRAAQLPRFQQEIFVHSFAAMEAMGVPTRAAAATIRDIPILNIGIPEEERNKTFAEVFSDPDSGALKRVRKWIRERDLPSAVKFFMELGVSIPEDPFAFLSGIISAGRTAVRLATRQAARRAPAKITPGAVIPDRAPDMIPIGPRVSEDLPLTPAQREFLETGTVAKKTAQREIGALDDASRVAIEINEGRTAQVAAELQRLRAKHGFMRLDKDKIAEDLASNAEKAYGRFKNEADELYDGINKVADPQILTANTKKFANQVFEDIGITGSRVIEPPPLTTAKFNEILAEAQRKGIPIAFRENKRGGPPIPVNKNTGKDLVDMSPKVIPAATATELGITKGAFSALKDAKTTLSGNVTTKALRNVKKALADAEGAAIKAGHRNSARLLRSARDDLNIAIANQMEETLGSPQLVKEWLKADKFFSGNVDAMKPMLRLVYDTKGNQRTPSQIIKIFSQQPTRKKGRIIDRALDFFDEDGIQILRNMYFNDIVKKSSDDLGNISGINLRSIINDQNPAVIDRVFTPAMKKDISDLMTDALADDVTKILTKAELRKYSEKKTASLLDELINVKPAYRLIMATRGFTRLSLKSLAPTFLIDTMRGIRAGVRRGKAERFLRNVEEAGAVKLLIKGTPKGGLTAARVGIVPASTRQMEVEGVRKQEKTKTGVDQETADFLEGL